MEGKERDGVDGPVRRLLGEVVGGGEGQQSVYVGGGILVSLELQIARFSPKFT